MNGNGHVAQMTRTRDVTTPKVFCQEAGRMNYFIDDLFPRCQLFCPRRRHAGDTARMFVLVYRDFVMDAALHSRRKVLTTEGTGFRHELQSNNAGLGIKIICQVH